MKITAIRGRNLASLGGDFELDLATGPLGAAGLFAITGPTGAGKTTLLDAMCLALYDTTPRNQGRSAAQVGREADDERVGDKDPRGLLRRGTGEGCAEVDFATHTGALWRARWEVQRARKRPTGRLQNAEVTLTDLATGARVAGNKRDVLAEIEAKVGLSFDQFRRSVLLAQGEFAAFLKADQRERAGLLEKVTGTDIYSKVSKAAFDKAKELRASLDALTTQLQAIGVLTDDARAELEAEVERAEADAQATQLAARAAEVTLGWHTTDARLVATLQQAEREVEAALAAQQRAEDRRRALAHVRAAAPLRTVLGLYDERTGQVEAARASALAATHRHAEAQTAHQAAAAALTRAHEAYTAARAAHDAALPALDEATALDATLRAAEVTLAQATTQAKAARDTAERAAKESADADAAHAVEAARLADAQVWLTANPDAARVAAQHTLLDEAVAEHTAATTARLAAQVDRARAERDRDAASTALNDQRPALTHADAALAEAEAESTRLAAAVVPAAHVQRARDAIHARATQLQAAADAAQRAAQAEMSRAEATSRQAAQTALAARAHAAAELATAEASSLRPRLDEARHSLSRLREARSLDQHRSALRDGEACPLCGSPDHPWAHGLPDGLEQPFVTRVAELEQALRTAEATAASERATAEAAARAAEAEARPLAAADVALSAALAAWADAVRPRAVPTLDALPDPDGELASCWSTLRQPLPATPDADAVDDARDELRHTSAALDHVAQAVAERQGQSDDAVVRFKEALRVQSATRARVTALVSALDRAGQELATFSAREAQAHDRITAAVAVLTRHAPADSWSAELEHSPAALRRRWRDLADRHVRQTQAVERGRAELHRMELLRERLREAVSTSAVTAESTADQLLRAQAQHSDLQHRRANLLGGRAVVAVRAALESAATAAEAAHRDAAARANAAAQAEAVGLAQLTDLSARVDALSDGARAAGEALHEAISAAGVDLPTLRARLVHPPAWEDQEAAALRALDDAVGRVASVAAERAQVLAAHCASQPAHDADTAATLAAEAAQAARAASLHLGEQRARVTADDTRRGDATGLRARIAQRHQQDARWMVLNDLIGSTDGVRFQRFAQGLTLDVLLAHANHQLRALAPRYALERVPGGDLDLQVIDRDLADEIRPVTSLSGGETFLASLALALGLGSLSSTHTPVDSLFIDEGFGTLDRDTLEVTLAALEALQRQGRKIGIVSHVEGLADQVDARVVVERRGGGLSRVLVRR